MLLKDYVILKVANVFLSVDDYNNNVNDYFASAFTSSLLGKNILGRISIKEGLLE